MSKNAVIKKIDSDFLPYFAPTNQEEEIKKKFWEAWKTVSITKEDLFSFSHSLHELTLCFLEVKKSLNLIIEFLNNSIQKNHEQIRKN